MTPLRLLAVPEVCAKLGDISRVSLWKLRAKGFPAPIIIGERLLRWVEPTVDAWIAAQPTECAVTAEQRARMAELGRRGGMARAASRRQA